MIDLGDDPVGEPPTSEEAAQLAAAIGALRTAGGIMDTGADIAWANGSYDREAPGGAGREIECSIGYRWQWVAGRMILRQINSGQISRILAIDDVTPGTTHDITEGFAPGTRWETVNGTIYTCTDATESAATWRREYSGNPSVSVWEYRAETGSLSGNPTAGKLIWNNADQVDATSINVSHKERGGTDIELILGFIQEWQQIFLQDRDSSENYQIWAVSGTPTVTDGGTANAYFTFPVELVDSGGTGTTGFADNHQLLFGTLTGGATPAQVSGPEITAGTETALRSYSPADVTAQVRAQQVHWQNELTILRWGSLVLEGNWPQLFTINNFNGDNDSTAIEIPGKAPVLNQVDFSDQQFNSAALAKLLADVARNADDFGIENGTLNMSGNPGTLEISDSVISANLEILDDLSWTVTYPILTVPSGTGGSYSGGNATVYWDDLPAWQSVDIEINGLFYTNVGGDTSPYTVSPGAGTTTVFRLRAKSGDVVTDWTSEITVTTPE